MSLFLNQHLKPCFRKPVLVRSSASPSIGSSSSMVRTRMEKKKDPMDLLNEKGTFKASRGWVATLKDDGLLRLQDVIIASDTDPKCILLPPLVTLPHCQTQIVTSVSMSSSYPEDDEDCVVAVKFLGNQLSFCRPARNYPEWTNVKIPNPCFTSSRVMYSKKDDMFRIPGSGGHIIGSWDLSTRTTPKAKFQKLRFRNLPKLTSAKRELLHSCSTTEHLAESESTGETFLVKWYRSSFGRIIKGHVVMKTRALMVFKLDDKGNAVYTEDIGDINIFLSQAAEPVCVHACSFNGLGSQIAILDFDEGGYVIRMKGSGNSTTLPAAYYVDPPDPQDLQR